MAKLTKLSVFSGLNHLTDLTMAPRFSTLLGYTPEEMDGPLRENIEVFAEKNNMDFDAAKKALLSWYDGYRFSPDSEAKVGNPWLDTILPVFYVGVNYNPEKRGIDDPLVSIPQVG